MRISTPLLLSLLFALSVTTFAQLEESEWEQLNNEVEALLRGSSR